MFPVLKIRTKYILFIALVHIVMIGLSFLIFIENKLYFIISEFFILASIYISWQLYTDFIAPMQLLMSGIDAIRDQDFNVKFLKTGKLEMDELIEVYNQMIDRLRQERTLQEQQHYFLEKLIQTSPTGILILDFDHHISEANAKALEITGATLDQLKAGVCTHPLLNPVRSLESGESKTIPIDHRIFKCQKSHFIDRGFKHYFVMIEELTQEILSAEKKAYGKVIRMMAHEVNNSIGAINSILDTVKKGEIHQSDRAHALQVAIERNDRLNQFMKNFADVVRLPEPRKEKMDINVLIVSVTDLIHFRATNDLIHFHFDLIPAPVWIQADVHQLEQVLINIIKNSIESIIQYRSRLNNEAYRGEIIFQTTLHPLSLRIKDNGAGISAMQSDQLFTPFFSTKPDGQGIGLALIKEILNNHRFRYSLKTNHTGITCFEIVFTES